MDTLGFDVEETKGENPRGSGYWEATPPMGKTPSPDETGAAPADGVREVRAELDELRREFAALRREGHKGVSTASTDEQRGAGGYGPSRGQTESSFKGDSRSARIRLRVPV